MYLYQKLNYKVIKLESEKSLKELKKNFNECASKYISFDTETTGLHHMLDYPFLMTFSFGNIVCLLKKEDFHKYINEFFNLAKKVNYLFAHNVKYDSHMLINAGYPIPENITLADSKTVARLTTYADDNSSLSLEALGIKYIDKNAKFAGATISKQLNKINATRLKYVKDVLKRFSKGNVKINEFELFKKWEELKLKKLPATINTIFKEYHKRVQFVKHEWDNLFNFIDSIYQSPNYYDCYKENPNLMISYALDDAVILNEYLKKAMPVLKKINPDLKTFNHENELIRPVIDMDRQGLRADIDYLLKSRLRVIEFKDKLYEIFWGFTKLKITANQHNEIKKFMSVTHDIKLEETNQKYLKTFSKNLSGEPKKFLDLVLEIRHVEKWLSTYIEGMLNRVVNGRLYTQTDNSGTVTGRVSNNLQQQPKKPLLDYEGNELFHPRRAIINDEGFKMFFFDYSQMEMRVQADYTIQLGNPDENLCNAFMPYQKTSIFTGEKFSFPKHKWNSGEWVNKKGEFWQAVDLHSATTLKAFPNKKPTDKDFKNYRSLGKMCNFLKNYGGGIKALKDTLDVNDEIANALNEGYYKAFPKILKYQNWVDNKLASQGYVENLLGRRYYFRQSSMFYKGYNYVIQGGCADILKNKQIKIYNFFKENAHLKSRLLLPVHDELIFKIADDEKYIVPKVKKILDDNLEFVKNIPLFCDVEYTETNWADKKDYNIGE